MIGRLSTRIGVSAREMSRRSSAQVLSMRHMSSGKDLRFSTEARNLMLKGVDALADAVEVWIDASHEWIWERRGESAGGS